MMPFADNNADSHFLEAKRKLRAEARRLRARLPDKDHRSRQIARALWEMPEFVAARTVMFYVDAGDEVRTRAMIVDALKENRRVVVPYCCGNELRLFCLMNMKELSPGAFGIDEPRSELRDLYERLVDARDIDLVVVPGVAFDPYGGRIGQGKGFYDRFLKTLARDMDDKGRFSASRDCCAKIVALAYECQIFPSVSTTEHDVPMDAIVTEERIYRVKEEE